MNPLSCFPPSIALGKQNFGGQAAISFLSVGNLSEGRLKHIEFKGIEHFSRIAMLTDAPSGVRIAMNSKRPDCAQFHIR